MKASPWDNGSKEPKLSTVWAEDFEFLAKKKQSFQIDCVSLLLMTIYKSNYRKMFICRGLHGHHNLVVVRGN